MPAIPQDIFLPASADEVRARGWDGLDVILVTGDAYIDSPQVGVAVIGKVLQDAGYRVGIIAQPATDHTGDIARLGQPRLFWGVSGGCIDSLVANYTAGGKRRRHDDYTPGGLNDRRPDRATIVYANLIRRAFKPSAPIVLGGIEASLRRLAHYDFRSDKLRRSVLLDAKADCLAYGMGERTVLEIARRLDAGQAIDDVRGTCVIAHEPRPGYLVLPDFEEVSRDPQAFCDMFTTFYHNNDPRSASGLAQRFGQRWVIQNPPALHLTTAELDRVYALDFAREAHPVHAERGPVKALETIRFSITTHRGCFGECSFCAIAVHEGRRVRSRSAASILDEARGLTRHPAFKGNIADVGGPTANMYGMHCARMQSRGCCPQRQCLHPAVCPQLALDHAPLTDLLQQLRALPGVKRVFVASGIRHDLVLADRRHGADYLEELAAHHVSGQLKLAPEHSQPAVLELMHKPGMPSLLEFRRLFLAASQRAGKKQFLTYYFIAAHPGCSDNDMRALKAFAGEHLALNPEQVQIFTPTPSTYSNLMYATGRDPFSGRDLFVEKHPQGKESQKKILTEKSRSWKKKKRAGHR